MTHKEQLAAIRAKVLVARLRRHDPFPSWEYMCDEAADEIERLVLKEEKLLRLSERYPDVPCDQLAKQIK